jgi:hypothetical protein
MKSESLFLTWMKTKISKVDCIVKNLVDSLSKIEPKVKNKVEAKMLVI